MLYICIHTYMCALVLLQLQLCMSVTFIIKKARQTRQLFMSHTRARIDTMHTTLLCMHIIKIYPRACQDRH